LEYCLFKKILARTELCSHQSIEAVTFPQFPDLSCFVVDSNRWVKPPLQEWQIKALSRQLLFPLAFNHSESLFLFFFFFCRLSPLTMEGAAAAANVLYVAAEAGIDGRKGGGTYVIGKGRWTLWNNMKKIKKNILDIFLSVSNMFVCLFGDFSLQRG
jgi:hypothetical protein